MTQYFQLYPPCTISGSVRYKYLPFSNVDNDAVWKEPLSLPIYTASPSKCRRGFRSSGLGRSAGVPSLFFTNQSLNLSDFIQFDLHAQGKPEAFQFDHYEAVIFLFDEGALDTI